MRGPNWKSQTKLSKAFKYKVMNLVTTVMDLYPDTTCYVSYLQGDKASDDINMTS